MFWLKLRNIWYLGLDWWNGSSVWLICISSMSSPSYLIPGLVSSRQSNYKWRNDELTGGRNCWWWFPYHLDEIFRIASDKFCLIKTEDDNILAGGGEVLIIDYLKYFSRQSLATGLWWSLMRPEKDKHGVMRSEVREWERGVQVEQAVWTVPLINDQYRKYL